MINQLIFISLKSNTTKLRSILFGFILLFSTYANAQTFVIWSEGAVTSPSSTLTTITGTYPGGIATVTNTGVGNDVKIGAEFNILNLNGASAAEVFSTYGSVTATPSKSLTFTFSTPVIINSFSIDDIDRGSWNDALAFSGVTFTSVITGGGVSANNTGTTVVPSDIGGSAEFANWFTSTTPISSFTVNYLITNNSTHAYLGYSMEVTATTTTIDIVGDTVVCVGDSVLLTAINDPIHSWALTSAPGNIISTDTSIYVPPLVTTTYAVYGTSDTAYHTINVSNPVQQINLGNDTTICQGQSVMLAANSPNATTYLWQDASTNPTFSASQTGIYWVQASNFCNTETDSISVTVLNLVQPINLGNDTTICPGQTVMLAANSPNATAYLWQDASTNSTFSASQTGIYWVQASNFCNAETDSISVTVLNLVQPINLGNDTTICPGQTVMLAANSPNATAYLWQDASTNPTFLASQTGIYWVLAGNMCGSEVDSIFITAAPLDIDLGPDTLICSGTSLLLDPGNIPSSFAWNDGSSNQTLSANNAGTYWVVGTLGNCIDSDTILVEMQELTPSFIAPNRVGCEPMYLNLGFVDQSLVNTGSIVGWDWDFGDTQTSILQNPSLDYQNDGLYDITLTITSNIGCIDNVTYPSYITVNPRAVANFNFGLNPGLALEYSEFINTSDYSTEWFWNFGDDSTSTLENPTHFYMDPGNYVVTLIATNVFGCSDTIEQSIDIVSEPIVYVPNTFTPNGDANNNVWSFAVSEIDIFDFSIQVYNRWGEIIWESHDPSQSWDGKYKGKIVQEGVYVWLLKCGHAATSKRYTYKGHVNVIR